MMVANNITSTDVISSATGKTFGSVRKAVSPLLNSVRLRLRRNALAAELNGLSERELEDMGFSRGDISAIVSTLR